MSLTMKSYAAGLFALLASSTTVFAADATATLSGLDGANHGSVTLAKSPSGQIMLMIELKDIPEGAHGFHIHETGSCDPGTDFKSAGGHLAGDHDHGTMAENGPHPGDFPNIHVPASGTLTLEYFTDRISLDASTAGLFDADGSSFIIHDGADDYSSQPSGNAGSRIACGVITKVN